jgi:hypothetical protein
MEHGPCRIKDDPKGVNDTVINPYAWNEHVRLFVFSFILRVKLSSVRDRS